MNKKPQWLFWLIIISLVASIATHFYLTSHHYNFKYGHGSENNLCHVNEYFNCDRTAVSSYSEVFGIPISIFGGLVNFVLFCLLLNLRFPLVGLNFDKGGKVLYSIEKLKTSARLLAFGIFLTSILMGTISLVVLKAYCPFCSFTYFLSLIVFVGTFWWLDRDFGFSDFKFDFKFFTGFAVFVLIFSFFIHHSSLRRYGGKDLLEMNRLKLQSWINAPVRSVVPFSPTNMNLSGKPQKNSKIQMTEFADFHCSHCARAFTVIHSFLRSHPQVEFLFQAFPLDGQCNPSIKDSYGIRCLLARLSHCAGEQNQGWKTQKWIFENQTRLLTQNQVQKKLKENLEFLELNEETLMSCMNSEKTREIILEQVKIGLKAGVKGTPTLFINGKKVPTGFDFHLLWQIHSHINKN